MKPVATTASPARFLLRAEAGAVAGLLGGIAVAALFFVQGAIHLHPLAVPSELASGLFGGAANNPGSTSGLGSDVVSVLKTLEYTIAHLLAFAAVGVSAAFILDGSRFWTSVWGGAAYVGAVCTGLLYAVSWIAVTPVALDVLGLPQVLLANMLAGAIIGTALYMAAHSVDRDGVTR